MSVKQQRACEQRRNKHKRYDPQKALDPGSKDLVKLQLADAIFVAKPGECGAVDLNAFKIGWHE
jgi:hypothetical protein